MVSMMRSGIMRLEEGGSPWYINIFGSQGEGETAEEKARREFLGKLFAQFSLGVPAGQANYDPFVGDEDGQMQWALWWLYNREFPGETPEPGTGTDTGGTEPGTDEPKTVFPAGSDLPSIEGYENGAIITVGDIKYILTNNLWKEYEEPGTSGDYGTDASGRPLPDPNDSRYGEGALYGAGDDLYQVINGKWEKYEEETSGNNQGGMFGLGIGPWLKDFFGATGVGGDVLSGIFGQGGNISDILKTLGLLKAYKETWDATQYEVPTGQGESMSDFEKANPFTGNMTLAGMKPNYLQGQDYGIPVGQQGVPAATHKIGKPFVEKVQAAQSGGIMNAKGHGDVVPALLEPDEFVFTRKAVQNMGGGDVRQGAKKMYSIMKSLEGMR